MVRGDGAGEFSAHTRPPRQTQNAKATIEYCMGMVLQAYTAPCQPGSQKYPTPADKTACLTPHHAPRPRLSSVFRRFAPRLFVLAGEIHFAAPAVSLVLLDLNPRFFVGTRPFFDEIVLPYDLELVASIRYFGQPVHFPISVILFVPIPQPPADLS